MRNRFAYPAEESTTCRKLRWPLCWIVLVNVPAKRLISFLEQFALTMTVCRGVRGATTVARDGRDEILNATTQLLALMIRRNGIESTDVASAIFTVTKDLQSEFPALAARQLGWIEVPLLCSYEVSVDRSLPRCIRVLLHWNTERTQSEIHHVYMREAVKLRPDLTQIPSVDFEELEEWIQKHLRDEC